MTDDRASGIDSDHEPGLAPAARTGRHRGTLAVAGVVATVGALTSAPGVVLASVVVAAVAAIGRTRTSPDPSLAISRELTPTDPDPGDTATVRLCVRNDGDARLPDCRVVDGVPDALDVDDGAPSLAVALAPGEPASTTYRVTVPGGEHAFDDPFVAVRDATGNVALTGRVAAGESSLSATTPLPDRDPVVLGSPSRGRPGRVASDGAGDGVAFRSVREYRRGDPAARVDWRRYARTGDLATVRYRETRAPTVVLVVDARERAHLAPRPDAESAIRRSVAAARRIAGGYDTARVGVVALAPGYPTVDPGTGREHERRLRERLDGLPGVAGAPSPVDATGNELADAVRARAPAGAQCCVCTPACDDAIVDAARRLDAHGHRVAVCSPDPTDAVDAGGRLAALERRARLRSLRRNGIAVADWSDEPLEAALARAGWVQ